jgi:hypothetical protein
MISSKVSLFAQHFFNNRLFIKVNLVWRGLLTSWHLSCTPLCSLGTRFAPKHSKLMKFFEVPANKSRCRKSSFPVKWLLNWHLPFVFLRNCVYYNSYFLCQALHYEMAVQIIMPSIAHLMSYYLEFPMMASSFLLHFQWWLSIVWKFMQILILFSLVNMFCLLFPIIFCACFWLSAAMAVN